MRSPQNKFSVIFADFAVEVAKAYPALLVFYLLSLAIAQFSPTWNAFFYWPAFHASVVVFGLIAATQLKSLLQFPVAVLAKARRTPKKTLVKIALAVLTAGFALVHGIQLIDFLFLVYALVAIPFSVIDERINAALALAFLAASPFFLLLSLPKLAELSATYSFYFLAITVVSFLFVSVQRDRSRA